MEKFNTFVVNSSSHPANLFQQKRQSKTLPFSGTKIDSIQILRPSNDKKLDTYQNFSDCDFDEPDRTIAVISGIE